MRFVDHQPCTMAAAQLDDLRQRRHVAFHREDAVDNHEDPTAVALGLLQALLEEVQAVVAERAQLGAREDAPVENRGMVTGVRDHGVARPEDRPERTEVGLVTGREHERGLGLEPLGELRSSSRCSAVVPFRNREPVSPVP